MAVPNVDGQFMKASEGSFLQEFKELVATGVLKHGAGLAAWARWMSRDENGN